MYTITDLKPGRAITLDGQPFLIIASQFGRKSQSKANMQCKLKNLKTGAVVAKNFQGSDKIEEADVGYKRVQFLYGNEAAGYTFMNLDDYDQFALQAETVEGIKDYLTEGLEVDAMVFDGNAIGIKMPSTVVLTVKETIPGVRGDTATGGGKPATTDTGLQVTVPLFINEGEKVRVNTETGEYMERVTG
ncbi:MAG: elongation factor P [Patescibacteria group bacterium]